MTLANHLPHKVLKLLQPLTMRATQTTLATLYFTSTFSLSLQKPGSLRCTALRSSLGVPSDSFE